MQIQSLEGEPKPPTGRKEKNQNRAKIPSHTIHDPGSSVPI